MESSQFNTIILTLETPIILPSALVNINIPLFQSNQTYKSFV